MYPIFIAVQMDLIFHLVLKMGPNPDYLLIKHLKTEIQSIISFVSALKMNRSTLVLLFISMAFVSLSSGTPLKINAFHLCDKDDTRGLSLQEIHNCKVTSYTVFGNY